MKSIYKLLLTLITVSFFSSLNAQISGIDWGQEDKGNRAIWGIKSLGWNNGNYYTIHSRPNSLGKYVFFLEKLDENLNLVYSEKLENKDYSYSFSKILNDKLYLFQIRNKGLSMKELEVVYKVYGLNSELIEEKVIAELDGFKRFNQLTDGYSFVASENGKHIAFGILDKNYKENYVRLINGRINVESIDKVDIQSKTIALEEDVDMSRLSELTVTNDGTIINTFGYRSDSEIPYLYQFLTLETDNNYKDPIYLNSENIYFDKVDIKQVGDQLMFQGLLLSDGEKRNLYNGFFLGKLDIEKNEIKDFSVFPYTEEFFKSLGYKIKKDGRVKFNGWFDLEIVSNNDGSGYLLADHRQSYNSYELVVIPFDKDGILSEDRIVLPKHQEVNAATKQGFGYFALSRNNKLYVLYNGVLDNLKISDLDELNDMKDVDKNKSATIVATLINNEKFEREKLFSFKEEGGYLVPDRSNSDDEKTIINIMDKRKLKYGLLEFKD